MSRVVTEETDLCKIGHMEPGCAWWEATLYMINCGSQLFFNCCASCCDHDGPVIQITMGLCIPFRLISALLFGMLGLMLDLLYMIFVLPFTFCYNLDGCAGWTLEGWGMKAIYRKDAKKQVRKSRTRDGKTEYYWETVSTWNVWNRTGPWQGFDCCTGRCCHAIFCMASWQGQVVSMGCTCCIEDDSSDRKEAPLERVEVKVDRKTSILAAGMKQNNAKKVANTTPTAVTSNDPPPAYDQSKIQQEGKRTATTNTNAQPPGNRPVTQQPENLTHGGRPAFVRLSSAIGIPVRSTSYADVNPD